jgi:ribonuclease P protein component
MVNFIGQEPSKKCVKLKSFSQFTLMKKSASRVYLDSFTASVLCLKRPEKEDVLDFHCGFVASKKGVHKRAHVRNRAKRRLRALSEIFKGCQLDTQNQMWLVVFFANQKTATLSAAQMRHDFQKMIQRMSICSSKYPSS